jgi:hypothetical protein
MRNQGTCRSLQRLSNMKFRTKQVEIEAMQFTPETLDECVAFCGGRYEYRTGGMGPPFGEAIAIDTLEGAMLALPGDFIIRGLKGEFYPCKPDIFALKYEPVQ